jgi:hypothetical protein
MQESRNRLHYHGWGPCGFLSCHFGTGQVAAERREKNAPGRLHQRAIEHDAIRCTKLEWNDAQTERIGTDRSEVNPAGLSSDAKTSACYGPSLR